MNTARTTAILVIGMAFICYGICAAAADSRAWLATGTVTKIYGPTIYLATRGNDIYAIDIANAAALTDGCSANCFQVSVGDEVRIYGFATGDHQIQAKRMRLITRPGAEKEVKIIVEKEADASGVGAGPQVSAPAPPPQAAACPPPNAWDGQGLITNINYEGRQVKLQTSSGNFTIDVGSASLSNGTYRTSFAMLNIGDAIHVTGSMVGFGEIQAAQISVMRTRYEAENALPLEPVTVVGIIQNVDYASYTFRMRPLTYSALVVSVDKNTVIQDQMCTAAFSDLRPGMKISMSGYGSPGSGYSAQHIQIIGTAP